MNINDFDSKEDTRYSKEDEVIEKIKNMINEHGAVTFSVCLNRYRQVPTSTKETGTIHCVIHVESINKYSFLFQGKDTTIMIIHFHLRTPDKKEVLAPFSGELNQENKRVSREYNLSYWLDPMLTEKTIQVAVENIVQQIIKCVQMRYIDIHGFDEHLVEYTVPGIFSMI